MRSRFSGDSIITTISIGILFIFFNTALVAQSEVNWLSWEEAMKLSQIEKRKVFVDVYTDWCGWCKRMDKTTFDHPAIADFLNDNFYCIKFDAEQKEPISLNGKTYRYVKNGKRGYHELAAKIMNSRLSFPTTVFLDENFRVIQPIAGYKSPEIFEVIISYFATDSFKTTPWAVYEKNYKPQKKEKGGFVEKGGN